MAHFIIDGRTYPVATLDAITGRDLLTFRRDASEVMGRSVSFFDIEQIADRIDALPKEEAKDDPDIELLTVVLIWVSRRAAGDTLSFAECLDEAFPTIVEGDERAVPKDRLPKKKSRPRASAAASAAVPEAVAAQP